MTDVDEAQALKFITRFDKAVKAFMSSRGQERRDDLEGLMMAMLPEEFYFLSAVFEIAVEKNTTIAQAVYELGLDDEVER